MEALRYSVVENNVNNEKNETDFGIYKEEALKYFESRCKEIDDELVGWKKETGINSCIWSKNGMYKLIYLQIDGIDGIEDLEM